MPFEGPLKPGDAVGVSFLTGDVEMGATGTVTHIDGDRVYAFGHPMYNLGPTEFPMTRAYVYTVLPSLASSFKLSTTGEVDRHVPAGSGDRDRRPAGPGSAHDSDHADARIAARRTAHVPLRRRQRPAVHALDDLCGDSRDARLVRAENGAESTRCARDWLLPLVRADISRMAA